MSRPLDPRLLKAAPSLRPYLLVTGACQVIAGLLIVAQAALIATIVVAVFAHHIDVHGVLSRLLLLGGVGVAKAGVAAAQEWLSARASMRVRAQLREVTLRAIVDLGPGWAQRQKPGRLVNATGAGLDVLDGYLTRSLPALMSASAVPAIVLAWITVTDWQSGVILLLTLPLVPLFMALVGITTKRRVQRQYLLLERMSGQFLDLVRGLTTLTVYGQTGRQQRTLRAATERYRVQTMSALKIAFLSALVLDLVATLSVAVVAVDVGLRLDAGDLSFMPALVLLLLAPEVFAPLRAIGTQYHANQAGTVAAAAALDIIDEAPVQVAISPTGRFVTDGSVALDGVTLTYPGRSEAALREAHLSAQPGELVALTGRSGAGKSSVLAALLGFTNPDRGQVIVGVDNELLALDNLDLDGWHANVGWLPQRPVPTQPTVAAEVRLGDPDADDQAVDAVCRLCSTPAPDTALGEDGRSVSAGQRRRIALARVMLRVAAATEHGAIPLVLLDEPSEDLDRATELVVAQVVSSLAGRATVIIATHSQTLAALADRRIVMDAGRVASNTVQHPVRPVPATASNLGRAEETERPVVVGEAPAHQLNLRQLVRAEGLRSRLILAVLLNGLTGLSGLALTGCSIWLISRAAEHPNVQALGIAVVGVRTFALGRALLRYGERLTAHDAALRLLTGLRGQVFAALGVLGPAAMGGFRRGDLLRRFVGDVDGLQDGLVRAFVPLSGAVITGAGCCLLAGLLVPGAGLTLAIMLVIAALLVPWATGRAAGESHELVRLAGIRDTRSNALIDGLAELTAYGAAEQARQQVVAVDKELTRMSRRPAFAATAGTGISAALAAIALPVVIALGAGAVHAGRLGGTSLGVLAVCVLVGFEAVAPLPAAFAVWQRCSAGLGRVARVLSKPAAFTDPAATDPAFTDPAFTDPAFTDPAFTDPAFTDPAATDPAATDPAVPSTIVARDIGIEARNIDLRPAVGAPRVLEHSSLRVDVGSRTALIGPSGCGKSTLLAALLRLVPLDSGVIELTHDGGVVDIVALRAADMPPLVAGSLQGDHVFDATLRDNLRVVKPGATDAELDRMAVKAGLTAFVTSLPLGWSTPAGPDGGALSGGQRQRLLLARALLADPHILLLDEPTAHLDADTEREILGDLLDATTGTTVLISTHRRLLAGQVDATLRIESTSITHERSDLAQRAEVLGRVAASMSEGL